MGPYLCNAASLSSSHNLTAGRIVASVWWTPSKWAVGSKVGPGVCWGRGVGLMVSLAVGFGVAAGRGVGRAVSLAVGLIVGRAVVGGCEGRGDAFSVGFGDVGGAEGRSVVGVGGATGRGVAFTVGRAVVGAATGRGVAFTVGRAVVAGRAVGRTVGEGSPAASARNRSALVAAMLTRSSNRCVQGRGCATRWARRAAVLSEIDRAESTA